jgi:purine-binding chemotaxis protein CheW
MKLPVGYDAELPVPQGFGPDSNLDGARQFITFLIDKEEYAVDILAVREIKAWAEVTNLPNTPQFVRGVINLRGEIFPVFDLRARFGMGLSVPTSRHVIIVVWTGKKLIGVLVDKVSEIVTLKAEEVKPVPEIGFSIDDEFLIGLAAVDDGLVALIDVERLFDVDALLADVNLND